MALVLKARRVGDSSHRSVTAGLNTSERALADLMVSAVDLLAQSASSNAIRDALRQGGVDNIVRAFPWANFSGALGNSAPILAGQLIDAGATVGADKRSLLPQQTGYLPTGSRVNYTFNRADPRAVAWAESQAAVLVQEVTNNTRLAVRGVIVDSVTSGASIADTRRRLQESVGLTASGAQSIGKLRARVFEQALLDGKSVSESNGIADSQAERYRKRLLKTRAESIARTEILRSTNNGRYLGWTQAMEQGLVSPDSTKKWSATNASIKGEVCSFCRPMNGEIIKWDQTFSNGVLMPPAHVNCRCTATLEPPQPDKRKEDVPQATDLSTPAPPAVGIRQSPIPAKLVPLDTTPPAPSRRKDRSNEIDKYDEEDLGKLRSLQGVTKERKDVWGSSVEYGKLTTKVGAQKFDYDTPKPHVRTSVEMDELIGKGWIETFRGVSAADGNIDARLMIDRIRFGETQWYGNGLFGHGTYSTTNYRTATLHYAFTDEEDLLGRLGYVDNSYGKNQGYLARMAVNPEANFIEYEVLERKVDLISTKLKINNRSSPDGNTAERGEYYDMATDPSYVAMSLGYDGIKVSNPVGQPNETYFVILNREAMAIQEHG